MITHPQLWRRFEARLQARRPLSYKKALDLFDALYREASAFGRLPTANRLEGLETDLKLAKALNRLTTDR